MTREELFDRYVADTLDEEATAELEALLTGDPEFAAKFAQDLLATGQFEQVGTEIRRIGESEADEAGESGAAGDGAAEPDFAGAAPAAERQPPPPPASGVLSPPSASSPTPPIPHQPGRTGALFGEHHEQPVLKSAQQKSPVGLIAIIMLLVAGIGAAVYFGLTREAPAAEATEPVIAQVDQAEGGVQLTRNLKTLPVESGTNLYEEDVVEVNEGSLRVAYVKERTYIHVGAGSQVRFEDHEPGKQIRLSMGEMTVEAGPQPVGRPMVITTDHVTATLRGTKVTVRAIARETLVEVSEGAVQVERKVDGEQVEVPAGAWVLAGDTDGPLYAWEFAAGVNLNGEAVTIDGSQWLSHGEATQQGMEVKGVERQAELRQALEPPTGAVPEAGVRDVLMSSVAAKSDRLAITWPQPNGQYQVFVWIMEHEGDQVRSLRLNLEEKLVGEELGKKQSQGEWTRFGPYPATITDGSLDVLMSADTKFQSHDSHLSGLALYRRIGAPPVAAPESPPSEDEAPEEEQEGSEESPDRGPEDPPPVEPPPRLPGQ